MSSATFDANSAGLAVKVTKPDEILHHQIEDWQLDVLTESADNPTRDVALAAFFGAIGTSPGAFAFIQEIASGVLISVET